MIDVIKFSHMNTGENSDGDQKRIVENLGSCSLLRLMGIRPLDPPNSQHSPIKVHN